MAVPARLLHPDLTAIIASETIPPLVAVLARLLHPDLHFPLSLQL